MGLYNYNGDFQIRNCIACNSDLISSNVGVPDRDSYDYKCNGLCNKLIVISGHAINSDFLVEFKANKSAQKALHLDVLYSSDDEYKIYLEDIIFFLGETYEEDLPKKSFELWDAGNMPGYPNKYKKLSEDDLGKINAKQEIIFERKVKERLQNFIKRFEIRSEKSSNPEELISFEIEEIKDLLSKSPIDSQKVEYGTFEFDSTTVKNIRSYHKKFITGSVDFNVVIHPKLKKLIGGQIHEEHDLINAKVFPEYIEYLQNLVVEPESYSKVEGNELEIKIDEILQKVTELGHGQEIIFDEIDSLKSLSKKLPKKDFKHIVIGKLLSLGAKKLIDSDFAHDVMENLFGEDLNLYLSG